jgi:hypothetical protein
LGGVHPDRRIHEKKRERSDTEAQKPRYKTEQQGDEAGFHNAGYNQLVETPSA